MDERRVGSIWSLVVEVYDRPQPEAGIERTLAFLGLLIPQGSLAALSDA